MIKYILSFICLIIFVIRLIMGAEIDGGMLMLWISAWGTAISAKLDNK